jgi:hypothetical protein
VGRAGNGEGEEEMGHRGVGLGRLGTLRGGFSIPPFPLIEVEERECPRAR